MGLKTLTVKNRHLSSKNIIQIWGSRHTYDYMVRVSMNLHDKDIHKIY